MTQCETEKFKSCFDVIGPVMIGPSSSHTAGALRIGNLVRTLLGETPNNVSVRYYESFAETHKGHGTDFALIGGILQFSTDDGRVPNALEHAKEQGLHIEFIEEEGNSPVQHPNTADVLLSSPNKTVRLIASSIGGGTVAVHHIELEHVTAQLRGNLPVILYDATNEENIVRLKYLLMENRMQIGAEQVFKTDDHVVAIFELDVLLTEQVKKELRANYEAQQLIILE